jgi:hypothetical protein
MEGPIESTLTGLPDGWSENSNSPATFGIAKVGTLSRLGSRAGSTLAVGNRLGVRNGETGRCANDVEGCVGRWVGKSDGCNEVSCDGASVGRPREGARLGTLFGNWDGSSDGATSRLGLGDREGSVAENFDPSIENPPKLDMRPFSISSSRIAAVCTAAGFVKAMISSR